jgi:hypothetical protein
MERGPEREWEPSPEQEAELAGYARRVAERLVTQRRMDIDALNLTVEVAREVDIELEDVGQSLDRFEDAERFLQARGEGFPCLEFADQPNDPPLPLDPELVGSVLSDEPHVVVRHDHDAARGFVRDRLGMFLFPRLRDRAVRGSTHAVGAAPSPGFPFRVETLTGSGFVVLFSPAYFLTPSQFGNRLSTPVDSQLLPGRYIFGTMSPGSGPPRWQSAVTFLVPSATTVAQVW